MATIPSLPLFTSGIAKSGQFNRLRDAIAFWQNPPSAMVTATANQSITNATWTLLTFGATAYDTDAIVTSTSRFTVKTAGRYSVVGKVVYASAATGRRWIAIRKNSTGTYVTGTLLYATNIAATSAADHVIIPPGPEFQLSVGDTLEAFTFQDSGGSLNTAASGSDIHMAVRLVQVTATTSGDEGTTLAGALVQTLLTTQDLNAVTTPGNYLQNISANATAGRNYPIVRAGHLEVHGGASSDFILQRYTEYDDSVARDVWIRTKYLTTWGAWQLIAPAAGGGSTDPEVVRDTMATALVAGSGVTITPNDGADTITIAATGGGGYALSSPAIEVVKNKRCLTLPHRTSTLTGDTFGAVSGGASGAQWSLGRTITVTEISVSLTAAGSAATDQFAIYAAAADGTIGSLVWQDGNADQTIGIKTWTGLSLSLPPGSYWTVALRVSGSNYMCATSGPVPADTAFDTTHNSYNVGTGMSAPFPSTWVGSTYTPHTRKAPLLALNVTAVS